MKGLAVTRARKESLRFSGFLFAALVLLSIPASAGGTSWTSRGLEGRSISSLVVDPSSPSRIYAAAGAEGIYQSTDGGENWARVDFGQPVEKVAIDERDAGTLYAIAGLRFKDSKATRRVRQRARQEGRQFHAVLDRERGAICGSRIADTSHAEQRIALRRLRVREPGASLR